MLNHICASVSSKSINMTELVQWKEFQNEWPNEWVNKWKCIKQLKLLKDSQKKTLTCPTLKVTISIDFGRIRERWREGREEKNSINFSKEEYCPRSTSIFPTPIHHQQHKKARVSTKYSKPQKRAWHFRKE
jgi:hypothetical protein